MPFDGSRPSNAGEILARMDEAFRSGEWRWAQEGEDNKPGDQCLVSGSRMIGAESYHDEVIDLIYRAIPGRKSSSKQSAIIRYNDRNGRTLDDILAVIRKAKTLA